MAVLTVVTATSPFILVHRVRELEKECSDLRDQVTLNDRLGALGADEALARRTYS